ncbi:putative tRNA N6-adenosine threonylcarbamoyltransferase, mitochondrial [Pseudolycoriella hygida]|uniref:N(6)-L-threonylcarbamoyladenine synthase n=1 Tax=Pseudolycoriella hygida TaxID=35572 RepID=A0A9Q0ML28_9DIPT|nr:putative tRNA N6-adenosine threonylcarbamoyltransferase, mitochondrial [Pseudolycoriella hygida]
MFRHISALRPVWLNKRTYTLGPTQRPYILGIETSCDDTGAAILNRDGNILSESVHSQHSQHLRYGGIIPPIAGELHRQNIENVVSEAFRKANLTPNDIDAIAVTNRPGLVMSLRIGVRYAKYLARKYNKPLIPVHHMEAHALTARMNNQIPFPFLCLLASGGHCILTLVKGVQDFYMLGETMDDAPGEAFDKIARRLKLRYLPEYEWMNGGQAIECASSKATNPNQFEFTLPLSQYKDCQFSFSGIKDNTRRIIERLERDNKLSPDEIIPDHENFCAGLLQTVTKHIARRTQRAIQFCEDNDYITDETGRRLVFSGGVACNDFIYNTLKELCDKLDYEIFRPMKQHCTDNGIMIAWNGMERWLENEETYRNINLDDVTVDPQAKLGTNLIENVVNANISCDWVKLSSLRKKN